MIVAHTGGNSKEFGGPIYCGAFTYNTCTQALAVCESPAYLDNIANVEQLHAELRQRELHGERHAVVAVRAGRLQGAPGLTVNLGLRYERQTFTDSRKDFAPRVGFAYNWRGDGKTVIRGGFGIYYSQIVDNSRGQLRADRAHRRVQLHRRAGPGRLPHQRRRGAAAGLSRGRAGAVAQPVHPARATLPISTSSSRPTR